MHRKLKRSIADLKAWLPDLEYTFDDMHRVDDTVCGRLTARGTNLGSVFGQPPTGRSIREPHVSRETNKLRLNPFLFAAALR